MNPTEARNAIQAALAEIAPEIDLAGCDPARPFAAQVDLDSMDVLEVLAALDARTGVAIDDTALPSAWSLDDLVAALCRR